MVFSFLEYLFFIFEILTFLYYANYESDDVMRFATQMVKYWIKYISGNIKAPGMSIFLKRKKDIPKRETPFSYFFFEKPFKEAAIIFHFSWAL